MFDPARTCAKTDAGAHHAQQGGSSKLYVQQAPESLTFPEQPAQVTPASPLPPSPMPGLVLAHESLGTAVPSGVDLLGALNFSWYQRFCLQS